MIQVMIEMDEGGQNLQIKASVPLPIVLAVVTSAYHELLSQKIRADFDTSVRLARRLPQDGRN
jgi:hypothetical protein